MSKLGCEMKTAETSSGQMYAAGFAFSSAESNTQGCEKPQQQAASIGATQPTESDPYPDRKDATVILAWLSRRLEAAARRSGLL